MAPNLKRSNALIIIYFVLAFFYFSQSFIWGEANSIGRPALIFIMLVNTIYMGKCIFNHRVTTNFSIAITIFVIINFAYYVFGDCFLHNVPDRKSFQIFKTVLLSTTCFFPLYYWTYKGYRLELLSGILALAYFLVIYISGQNNAKDINTVDNMGYYYLNFIPFLILIKGHVYIKIVLCLVLNVLIITCAKRGAIITAALVDVIFFYYIYQSNQLKNGLLTKIWILMLICCAAIYAWQRFQSNSFVLERFIALQQGSSSGRDIIYANLWNNWSLKYDIIQQIFGGGFCKSPQFNNGLFAHNDWLELLIDLGLVGIISYVFVIVNMLKLSYLAVTKSSKYCILIISSIWFAKTLFSMSFLDENNFILMLLLGVMAAKTKREKYETKKISLGQCS